MRLGTSTRAAVPAAAMAEGQVGRPREKLVRCAERRPSSLTGWHPFCRLGGSPVCTRLPFKPMRLQPVKQGAGPGGAAYRAFVSSSTYTQAYRIAAGLLPKLHTLHEHLTSSGIPILGSLQPGCHGAKYSCDGLRAMPLHQVSWE